MQVGESFFKIFIQVVIFSPKNVESGQKMLKHFLLIEQ